MILNYLFEGIDCINCADSLENKLKKIKGVNNVNINYFMNTIDLDIENMEVLQDILKVCDKFEGGVTLISIEGQ